MQIRIRLQFLVIVFLFLIFPLLHISAASYTWTGAASNEWSNSANWESDSASEYPSSGDTAEFNQSATITLTEDITVATVNITVDADFTLTLSGNYTLTCDTFDFPEYSHSYEVSIASGTTFVITTTLYADSSGNGNLIFSGSGTLYIPQSGAIVDWGESVITYNLTPLPYVSTAAAIYRLSVTGMDDFPSSDVTINLTRQSATSSATVSYPFEVSITNTSSAVFSLAGTDLSDGYTNDSSNIFALESGIASKDFTLSCSDADSLNAADGITIIIYAPDGSGLIIGEVSYYKGNPVWTGATSSDWSTLGNWTGIDDIDELDGADISINSGVENYPVISSDVNISSLSISSAAHVTMTSGTLSVETLSCSGTGYFDGSAGGTVEFSGTASWDAKYPSNSSFCNISIASDASLTLEAELILSGNWTDNSSGVLTQNSSSYVSFIHESEDAVSVITGNTSFQYLRCKETSVAATLTINGDIAVTSSFNLSGYSYAKMLSINGSGSVTATGEDGSYLIVDKDSVTISSFTAEKSIFSDGTTGESNGWTLTDWLTFTDNGFPVDSISIELDDSVADDISKCLFKTEISSSADFKIVNDSSEYFSFSDGTASNYLAGTNFDLTCEDLLELSVDDSFELDIYCVIDDSDDTEIKVATLTVTMDISGASEDVIWTGYKSTDASDVENWIGISSVSELENYDIVIETPKEITFSVTTNLTEDAVDVSYSYTITNFPVISEDFSMKSLTINADSNVSMSASSFTVESITCSDTGYFSGSAGTVIFSATDAWTASSVSSTFYDVQLASGSTFTLSDNVAITNCLTVSGGTFISNSEVSIPTVLEESGVITTNAAFTADSITISAGTFTANASITVPSLSIATGNFLVNSTFSNTTTSVSGGSFASSTAITIPLLSIGTGGGLIEQTGDYTLTISAINISSSFQLKADSTASNITVASDSVSYGGYSIEILGSGTVILPPNSSSDSTGNFVVTSGTLNFSGEETVSSITLEEDGILSLTSKLYLIGNWIGNGGAVEQSGTDAYVSVIASSVISGTTDFAYFRCDEIDSSITLTVNGDISVSGKIILSGYSYDERLIINGTGTITINGEQNEGSYLLVDVSGPVVSPIFVGAKSNFSDWSCGELNGWVLANPFYLGLSVAPIGDNELYLAFDTLLRDSDDNVLTSSMSDELLDLVQKFTIVTYSGEDADVSIDETVPAKILTQGDECMGIVLSLTKNVTVEDLLDSYIGLKSGAYIVWGTNKKVLDIEKKHVLSDFAVNAVETLYAASNLTLTSGDPVGSNYIARDFSSNSGNSGNVLYDLSTDDDYTVTVYTHVDDGSSSDSFDYKLRMYVDVKSNISFDADYYTLYTGNTTRAWLPVSHSAFSSSSHSASYVEETEGSASYLRNFSLPFEGDDTTFSSWGEGSEIQFLFQLLDSSGDAIYIDCDFDGNAETPLYALRLSDSSDLSSLDLWSFRLTGITKQRGGVSILNNVINATNGEYSTIEIDMPSESSLSVYVMTLDGNIIQTLQKGRTSAGTHRYIWNGKNKAGNAVARGMYFVRVLGPDIDETRKILVVKD
ncbi:MAG: hypothetical protein K6F69_09945 [Treponema sp.]|nr:hypothetical protein [Treponema sp.]